jgi:hypothetical protein
VSWQVTGVRQDAYAKAHRIQVEEEKPPREQGRYENHWLEVDRVQDGSSHTIFSGLGYFL